MAVAELGTPTGFIMNGLDDASGTHTPGSAPELAVVCLNWYPETATITSCKYGGSGGQEMTLLASDADAGDERASIYYIVNPTATGATTVVTAYSSGVNGYAVVRTFSGVDTSTPFGTPATSNGATGTSTSTEAVASDANGLVVDSVSEYNQTPTAGGSQTSVVSGSSSGQWGGSSLKAGASSVTMSWSWGSNSTWAHVVAPIRAAGGGGGGQAPRTMHHFRQLLGA